jgi:hypothetical protein
MSLTEKLSATSVVQRAAAGSAEFGGPATAKPGGAQPTQGGSVHAAAAKGISSPSSALPHLDRIQQLFGRHDVSRVEAHIGGSASLACREMKAVAFATGNHVVFRESPDLHTAAHEAAHVVQQRAGIDLPGGVDRGDDAHERHADAVAARVVSGLSGFTFTADWGRRATATSRTPIWLPMRS